MRWRPVSATTLRRAHVRVQGTVQGVGFRPYVYRLAGELGLAGFVLNDARGVLLEVEGDDAAVERFLARLPAEAPPLASVERVVGGVARAGRAQRLPDRPEPARRARRRPGHARHRDLRGLPARAVRPRRPPPPLPVRQLHQLRPALHDRARHPLRPAAHDDGRFPHVRAAARPSTTTRRTGASTPSPTPARPAGRSLSGCSTATAASTPATRDAAAGCRGRPARRRDRRDQGHRRLPPGLPGRRRARRWPALRAAQAPRGQAVRADGGVAGRRRGAGPARRRPSAPCSRAASARSCWRRAGHGAAVAPAVAPGAPELGVMLPYSPLHHLLLADVAELDAVPGRAGDDQRQRLRRADRLPRRGRASSGWAGSPTCCSCTTGRSRPASTIRWCASWCHAGTAAPDDAPPLARLRARRAAAARRRPRARSWPAAPS